MFAGYKTKASIPHKTGYGPLGLKTLLAIGFGTIASIGFFAENAFAREIKSYDISTTATETFLQLKIDESTSFDAFTLTNPPRLVIDLPKLSNAETVAGRSGGFILKTRVGVHSEEYNRFVLDLSHNIVLNQPQVIRGNGSHTLRVSMSASPNNQFVEQAYNHRDQAYVSQPADFVPKSSPIPFQKPVRTSQTPTTVVLEQPKVNKVPLPSLKPKRASFKPVTFNTMKTSQNSAYGIRGSSRKPVIIIDPGHGGKDPGAISVSGVNEKDLNLTFGAELATVLINSGKYKVYLTRNKDVFIPLRERTRLAESVQGDLFISIHADSNTETEARGASFYTLSEQASDKEAQLMAERENAAFLMKGDLNSASQEGVQTILNSLAFRETMIHSRLFADQLTRNVSQIWPTRARPHRRAGFAVLKSSKMPAVLLEMGYLTNKLDEQILMVPGYRMTLANGIKSSIDSYFRLMNSDTVSK